MKKQDVLRAQRRRQFLGMNPATAHYRLRKNVLFHLVTKYGENECHVCSEILESVEELSIEHIKPWEGRDAKLYWDMKNITFSHLRCNKNHSYADGESRKFKSNDPNKHWCARHKKFLDKNKFTKNSNKWHGFETYCKECRSVLRKKI